MANNNQGNRDREQVRPRRKSDDPPPYLSAKCDAGEWKLWLQMWNIYVEIARLENETQAYKKARFLHTLGPDGLMIYNGLEIDNNADVNAIIQALNVYFIGQTNETFERYVFNKREQKDGETVEQYVCTLRQLAKTCNFPDAMLNSLIRDRVVLGIKNQKTREALLQIHNLD